MSFGSYREGRVHIVSKMCDTCIFRPGNLMDLKDGRREEMERIATKGDTAIVCHSTLEGEQVVCRGFYDRHSTTPLRLAAAMGLIVFDKPRSIMKQKVSRQVQYQRLHMKNGLCSQCADPLAPGSSSHCVKHRDNYRVRNRNKYRLKRGIPLDKPLHGKQVRRKA